VVRVIERYWSSVPGFAKILLVVQAVVIVVLSSWMYSEYVNNQYLQAYLYGLLAGQGSVLAMLSLGGVVGTALIGILLKAGNILGEIEHLSDNAETVLEERAVTVVKQNLMPVLKVARPGPKGEIGQLHGSLQRWKEHSILEEQP
jgi:Na+-translocating ferredoxin:NAD+ oxidoreductase RnfE subunit